MLGHDLFRNFGATDAETAHQILTICFRGENDKARKPVPSAF
jgi:hypothetical protein